MSDDQKAEESPIPAADFRGRITKLRKLKFVVFLSIKLEGSEDAASVKVMLCSGQESSSPTPEHDLPSQSTQQRHQPSKPGSGSTSQPVHCCSLSLAKHPLHFRLGNGWDFHQARVELRQGDRICVSAAKAEEDATSNVPFYKAICVSLISRWRDDFPDLDFFRSSYVFNNTNEGLQSSSNVHCSHWLASKHCSVANCKFLHADPKSREFLQARREEYDLKRKLRLQKQEERARAHGPMASKEKRAVEFAKFLVAEYDESMLCRGSGVLDVAGGRGDVSYELACMRGISATLVEPRYRKPSKAQKGKIDQIALSLESTTTSTSVSSWSKRGPCLFRHIRGKMAHDGSICDVVESSGVGRGAEGAAAVGVDLEGMCRDTSILVGMHPDQATEAIVRAAVKLRKPFAIVPCCVFAREFPDRCTPDGRRVTSFKDFIDFLAAIAGFKFAPDPKITPSIGAKLDAEERNAAAGDANPGCSAEGKAKSAKQAHTEDTSSFSVSTFEALNPLEAVPPAKGETRYNEQYDLKLRQLSFVGKNVVLFSKAR